MKRTYRVMLLALLFGVLLCLRAQPALAIGKAVYLDADSITLYPGETRTLIMYVGGGPSTASGWSSSNTKVASVSKKGAVTAKKAGKATITCKTGFGYSLTCKVTVEKQVEVSGYLNKNYEKLAKKVPEAKPLSKGQDPAGIGNVYVFRLSKGEEPFFRYDVKTGKVISLQLSNTMGDERQKGFALYGLSLEMPGKQAKAVLKAKKWSYTGKQKGSSATLLHYKKSGHTLTVYVTGGKVSGLQWNA